MTININSANAKIRGTCSSLIRQLFIDAVVINSTDGARRTKADFQIFDYVPGSPMADNQFETSRFGVIFLVHRQDLARFVPECPGIGWIVLKPLDKVTFATNLRAISKIAAESEASVRKDRAILLESLLQANLELQQQDRDRADFIARAAHDLRSPLTTFAGYCGLLETGNLGELNALQREVLRIMRNSAKRLERIAQSLFEISIDRSSETELDFAACDFRECVEQAVAEIRPVAAEKRITLSVKCEPSSSELYLDRLRMEQVLVNLLENACRFAPVAGKISVHAYPDRIDSGEGRESIGYRCDVSNSGPGLEPGLMTKVFEQSVSAGPDDGRAHHGLGLSICKKIVSGHKGQIWAENMEGGVKFSFVLPFGKTGEVHAPRTMTAKAASLGA